MKKFTKVFILASLLYVLIFLFLVSNATATEQSDFVISNGTISKYNGTDENLVIPSNLGITKLGVYSFARNTTLKSIVIPEGVKEIHMGAFSNCTSLSNITLPSSIEYVGPHGFERTPWFTEQPDGELFVGKVFYRYKNSLKMPVNTDFSIREGTVSICDYAFGNCDKLVSVSIPESVKTIGYNSFFNCNNLIKFSVNENNLNFKSIDGVLFNKTGTTMIKYPSAKPETIYSIPRGVETVSGGSVGMGIGGTATHVFENNKFLEILNIPASVKIIEPGAIVNCKALEEVNVDESNAYFRSIDGVLFDKSISKIIKYPSGKLTKSYYIPQTVTSVESIAFDECKWLEEVQIPEGVKNIGTLLFPGQSLGAFKGCTSLKSIILPGSITKLGEYSFSGCSNLVSVALSNRITEIPSHAFANCKQLESIYLPITVNSISYSAFENCASLESVTIPATNVTIDKSTFNLSKLVKLYGLSGSNTEIFAKQNNIPFEVISIIKDAIRTASSVAVNGSPVAFEAYNIDSNNYFKLRDIAKVLSGSAKQFEVGWDSGNNAIGLTTGKSYTSMGGELEASSNTQNKKAALSSSRVYLNGKAVSLTAYNIDGNNYFKLRDLGAAIDFGVEWSNATSSIGIDTNKIYVE